MNRVVNRNELPGSFVLAAVLAVISGMSVAIDASAASARTTTRPVAVPTPSSTATTDRARPPSAWYDRTLAKTSDRAVRGWSVRVDNDLFAFGADDRDYTAGVSVTLGGERAMGNVVSGALGWLDDRVGFGGLPHDQGLRKQSFEAGLLLFTPQDLSDRDPQLDDRPYANLAYVSSSQLTSNAANDVAYQSSLTLGFLGLPFAEQLHRGVHDAVGAEEPLGYTHQISDGGEPTFRYSVTRYRLLSRGSFDRRPYNLRLGLTGSVGYLTEANAELAFRWGDLDSSWWSSVPSASDYAGHPAIDDVLHDARAPKMRLQFSAGITARARLYNSFLQGQLRSSDVTYSSSELKHLLLEAWVGLTTVFRNNLSVSYTLRHQTEELKSGRGERGFTWASIGVAQQF